MSVTRWCRALVEEVREDQAERLGSEALILVLGGDEDVNVGVASVRVRLLEDLDEAHHLLAEGDHQLGQLLLRLERPALLGRSPPARHLGRRSQLAQAPGVFGSQRLEPHSRPASRTGLAGPGRFEGPLLDGPVRHRQCRGLLHLVPGAGQIGHRLGDHQPVAIVESAGAARSPDGGRATRARPRRGTECGTRAATSSGWPRGCCPSVMPMVIWTGLSMPFSRALASTRPTARSIAASGSSSRPKVSARWSRHLGIGRSQQCRGRAPGPRRAAAHGATSRSRRSCPLWTNSQRP